ncbi:MAG: hypothetical protein OK457_08475, partial [Thaumarchaeota archaeon]|nr:hypothetical protein [Nitrososphaerota archaeon]
MTYAKARRKKGSLSRDFDRGAGQLEDKVNRDLCINGILPKDAFTKFTDDVLKNYDPLVPLSAVVQSLEIKSNKLKETLETRTEEVKALDLQKGARKGEIDAYSQLRSKGIDDETILRWERIMSESHLTPQVVEAELKKNARLEKLFKEKEAALQKLEGREMELKVVVETLELGKKQLETF